MTPRLDTMLDLCRRATKGPWHQHHRAPDAVEMSPGYWWQWGHHPENSFDKTRDAAFISSCDPQTIEAMIGLLKEARGFAEVVLCNFPGIDKGLGAFDWLKKYDEFNKVGPSYE